MIKAFTVWNVRKFFGTSRPPLFYEQQRDVPLALYEPEVRDRFQLHLYETVKRGDQIGFRYRLVE